MKKCKCGSRGGVIDFGYEGLDIVYYKRCYDCGHHGPSATTLRGASAAWNKAMTKWKPVVGERYWVVSSSGLIEESTVGAGNRSDSHIKMNNCFKTKKEAQKARTAIRRLLRGL